MVVAEVLLIAPDKEITVNGEKLPALIVQGTFSFLTREHVERVLEYLKTTTALITNKSGYIRTALYNSVRELHTHYQNQVKHDFGC